MKLLPVVCVVWMVTQVPAEEKMKSSIFNGNPIRVEDYGKPPATFTIPLYDCTNSHRPKGENANAFQIYHNGEWYTQFCQDGLVWNQTMCRCEYPNGKRPQVECRDYRAAEPTHKYEQMVNGQWIIRDCSLAVAGLVWDQKACQCVWGPNSKEMVIGQGITPCDVMLNMTFEEGVKDEAKGSFVEIGRGVPVAIYTLNKHEAVDGVKAAYFTDTALNIWYFAGNEMGTSLRVEFRFKMTNDPSQRDKYQIFLSNGCNVSAPGYTTPSVAIGYRAADQSYLLAFETASARKAIVCSKKLGAYDWHTISLIYEDGTLLFRVDEHPCIISQDFSGPVQKNPCPLTIGADPLERQSMYKGYLDNLMIARYCRRYFDSEPSDKQVETKGPMPVETAPAVANVIGIALVHKHPDKGAGPGQAAGESHGKVISTKYFSPFPFHRNSQDSSRTKDNFPEADEHEGDFQRSGSQGALVGGHDSSVNSGAQKFHNSDQGKILERSGQAGDNERKSGQSDQHGVHSSRSDGFKMDKSYEIKYENGDSAYRQADVSKHNSHSSAYGGPGKVYEHLGNSNRHTNDLGNSGKAEGFGQSSSDMEKGDRLGHKSSNPPQSAGPEINVRANENKPGIHQLQGKVAGDPESTSKAVGQKDSSRLTESAPGAEEYNRNIGSWDRTSVDFDNFGRSHTSGDDAGTSRKNNKDTRVFQPEIYDSSEEAGGSKKDLGQLEKTPVNNRHYGTQQGSHAAGYSDLDTSGNDGGSAIDYGKPQDFSERFDNSETRGKIFGTSRPDYGFTNNHVIINDQRNSFGNSGNDFDASDDYRRNGYVKNLEDSDLSGRVDTFEKDNKKNIANSEKGQGLENRENDDRHSNDFLSRKSDKQRFDMSKDTNSYDRREEAERSSAGYVHGNNEPDGNDSEFDTRRKTHNSLMGTSGPHDRNGHTNTQESGSGAAIRNIHASGHNEVMDETRMMRTGTSKNQDDFSKSVDEGNAGSDESTLRNHGDSPLHKQTASDGQIMGSSHNTNPSRSPKQGRRTSLSVAGGNLVKGRRRFGSKKTNWYDKVDSVETSKQESQNIHEKLSPDGSERKQESQNIHGKLSPNGSERNQESQNIHEKLSPDGSERKQESRNIHEKLSPDGSERNQGNSPKMMEYDQGKVDLIGKIDERHKGAYPTGSHLVYTSSSQSSEETESHNQRLHFADSSFPKGPTSSPSMKDPGYLRRPDQDLTTDDVYADDDFPEVEDSDSVIKVPAYIQTKNYQDNGESYSDEKGKRDVQLTNTNLHLSKDASLAIKEKAEVYNLHKPDGRSEKFQSEASRLDMPIDVTRLKTSQVADRVDREDTDTVASAPLNQKRTGHH